mmetsp:Transcript_183398/g.581696  ORF Transcript_183398/g.581696 Transcript_183398/m.581696 type:complete len:278 (+) Transcript_183398:489-1322(+)
MVVNQMMSRSYFGKHCNPAKTTYNRHDYVSIDLLGKTFRYTTDISGVGCGCNAAVYLTSMEQNRRKSEYGDFYCDAAKVGGIACGEIDLQEANEHAWLSTLHGYTKRLGQVGEDILGLSLGFGGSNGHPIRRDWSNTDYGRGGRCVDTSHAFEVAVSFPMDASGALAAFEVQLSQKGRPCELTARHEAYPVKGRGGSLIPEHRDGFKEVTKFLRAGMTPMVSYWKSNDLLWMDGIGLDGRGACAKDRAEDCPNAVRFYNFSVEAIGAENRGSVLRDE